MSGNEQNQEQQPQQNIHAATSPQACIEMGKRYGWKLLGWQITNAPILRVNCVFEGEQTSFEDERYD